MSKRRPLKVLRKKPAKALAEAELQGLKVAVAQRQVNDAINVIDAFEQLLEQASTHKNPGAAVQVARLRTILEKV